MANIVIAFPKMEDAIGIKNLLVRNGYPVTAVCTSVTFDGEGTILQKNN